MRQRLRRWVRWWFGIRDPVFQEPPPQMRVTAIVPAYNEENDLRQTVRALLDQTYVLAKIIIVDDCSTDRTNAIAKEFVGLSKTVPVLVLRAEKNQGTKAQALNYGLPYVDTELFVIVDGDTVLAKTAVYEAMRCYNDPLAEMVSGSVLPQKVETFWQYARLVEYLYAVAIIKPAQEHNGVVLIQSGCFCIFRTETVRKIGGFNPRTVTEDCDATTTILEQGGHGHFQSTALCYPAEPRNFKQWYGQSDRWYRGYFQVLKVRGFKPFPNDWRPRYLTYAYMLWYVIAAPLTPISLYFYLADIRQAILLTLIVDSIGVWLPVFYKARHFGVSYRKVAIGCIPYLVTPYMNMCMYIRSFFIEVVMRKELHTWNKGH